MLLLLSLACAFKPTQGPWDLTVQTDTEWDCTSGGEYYAAGDGWTMILERDRETVALELGHDDEVDDCSYSSPDIACTETRVDDYSDTFDVLITWVDSLEASFVEEDRLEGTLTTTISCEGADCETRGLQFAPADDTIWPCVGETQVCARPQ